MLWLTIAGGEEEASEVLVTQPVCCGYLATRTFPNGRPSPALITADPGCAAPIDEVERAELPLLGW
jgi:hypothetical protein